jgi:uncharacterized protein YjhX (UPF0386 family)
MALDLFQKHKEKRWIDSKNTENYLFSLPFDVETNDE